MRTLTAVPATAADCELGEGPTWLPGQRTLAWVDITGRSLHTATTTGDGLRRRPTITIDRTLGAVAPLPGGDWLAAAGDGFVTITADGRLTELQQPEAGRSGVRMNDGKCDPRGRFLAGSMSPAHTGAGSLYLLDLDGSLRRMRSGLGIANGIGWSPDGAVMYHVDSSRGTVDEFDYDLDDGRARHRRTLLEFAKPDTPDGLCVDDSGAIWLALWDGGRVQRHTPEGAVDTVVDLPVSRPTSCCFGDGVLYITSAREDEPGRAGEPLAGAVFTCTPGVSGPAPPAYGGSIG